MRPQYKPCNYAPKFNQNSFPHWAHNISNRPCQVLPPRPSTEIGKGPEVFLQRRLRGGLSWNLPPTPAHPGDFLSVCQPPFLLSQPPPCPYSTATSYVWPPWLPQGTPRASSSPSHKQMFWQCMTFRRLRGRFVYLFVCLLWHWVEFRASRMFPNPTGEMGGPSSPQSANPRSDYISVNKLDEPLA